MNLLTPGLAHSQGTGEGQSWDYDPGVLPHPARIPHGRLSPCWGRDAIPSLGTPVRSPCRLWSMGKCLVSSKALLMTGPLRSAWMESTWAAGSSKLVWPLQPSRGRNPQPLPQLLALLFSPGVMGGPRGQAGGGDKGPTWLKRCSRQP